MLVGAKLTLFKKEMYCLLLKLQWLITTIGILSCYIANQLAGGLLLKMLKPFEVMLNIFEFFHVKEIDWCM